MRTAHDLAMALRFVHMSVHHRANAEFARVGLNADQFVLRTAMAEDDGLTQQELVPRPPCPEYNGQDAGAVKTRPEAFSQERADHADRIIRPQDAGACRPGPGGMSLPVSRRPDAGRPTPGKPRRPRGFPAKRRREVGPLGRRREARRGAELPLDDHRHGGRRRPIRRGRWRHHGTDREGRLHARRDALRARAGWSS